MYNERGSTTNKKLSDSNWGTLDNASRVPQLHRQIEFRHLHRAMNAANDVYWRHTMQAQELV